MLQNKIYQNYTIEILKLFLTILFGLSIIAWTVRAVNFLDLIVENGYPVITYFLYSFLNLFGILSKFIPLSFLFAITIFILRQMQENELIILWTSGVKKIQIANLIFFTSTAVTLFYLIFSVFITPYALNKSRMLLAQKNLTSFLPTIRAQQFNDSFSGLTFVVDEKSGNQVKNVFLQDTSNILKSISTGDIKKKKKTIIGKSGIIENQDMMLFEGIIISSNPETNENEIMKFDQLNISLKNIQSLTIKQPKIQETDTINLIGCINNNFFNNKNCKEGLQKEMIPYLNRRIVLPFFIPVVALIASLLLLGPKKSIFLNKVSIFIYSFLILLYSELIIRYTGLSKIINNLFILFTFFLIAFTYFLLRLNLSKE